MTTKEKMEALCRGETLVNDAGDSLFMRGETLVYDQKHDYYTHSPIEALRWDSWKIKPKHAMRLMTRDEVLGFVANTPGIVVRFGEEPWLPPKTLNYAHSIDRYEWTTVSLDGVYGEPRKFEKGVK